MSGCWTGHFPQWQIVFTCCNRFLLHFVWLYLCFVHRDGHREITTYFSVAPFWICLIDSFISTTTTVSRTILPFLFVLSEPLEEDYRHGIFAAREWVVLLYEQQNRRGREAPQWEWVTPINERYDQHGPEVKYVLNTIRCPETSRSASAEQWNNAIVSQMFVVQHVRTIATTLTEFVETKMLFFLVW